MPGARRVLAAVALLALSVGWSPARAAEASQVLVSDNFFQPVAITVQAGSTVTWVHQGDLPHTVTANDQSFDSHPACTTAFPGACMERGDTYERAFPETGTFQYFCRLHAGMTGSVRVVEPGFVSPTEILDLRAIKSGSTLRVIGAASFGGLAPFEVGTDPAGDSVHGLPAGLGYDLTKASIGQPDAASGDISFVLELADLPPTGGLPDAAVYFWDLNLVPPGGQPYGFRIMGSLSDLTRIPTPSTETPAFTLHGCGTDAANCTSTGTPVDAVMDGEANRITVTVPTGALAQATGQPVIGSEIVRGTFGHEGVAVRTDPQTNSLPGPMTDHLTISGSQTVAERSVAIDVVPVGATPAFDTAAVLNPNGQFSAEVAGLASGTYDVWARACFGSNCAESSTPATL